MSFGYPLALVLLAGLPIIVWLHLRRRRPRPMRVPSLSPWLSLLAATPPRRQRVPPTLLLLLHLAVAASLALAAACPRGFGGADPARERVLVLDRSASMRVAGRWSEARALARDLLATSSGEVGVVAMDARPRVLVAGDPDGRAARAALERLAPSIEAGANLDQALALAAAVARPGAEIVVIGDPGLGRPSAGAPPARFERVGSAVDNLGLSDAALRQAAGGLWLFARASSFADQAREARLGLWVDGSEIASRELTLAPGESQDAAWSLPPSAREVTLALDAGDAWPDDDRRQLRPELPGTRIQLAGESPALARALAALPGATLARVGLGDYRTDAWPQVSVFVGPAPLDPPPGGLLLVRPEPGGSLAITGEPRNGRVVDAGTGRLAEGLDLSGLNLVGLRAMEAPAGAEVLLQTDSLPAILAWSGPTGRVMVMAFDPERGGLMDRLAFPLLVARAVAWLAEGGTGGAEPSVGEAVAMAPPLAEQDLRGAAEGWPADRARPLAVPGGRPLWPWLAGLALLLLMIEGAWRAGLLGAARRRTRGEAMGSGAA